MVDRRDDEREEIATRVVGADWDGRTISREDVFEAALFVDCDFTEITNPGASFTGCTFGNVKFNAPLRGLRLRPRRTRPDDSRSARRNHHERSSDHDR